MTFKVIGTVRGIGKEIFVPLGDPEELGEGKSLYEVGDSSLSLIVSKGGSRLFVCLDESKGDIAVRPLGDDVERFMQEYGVTGIELDARLLPDGKTVARLLDSDEAGTLYRYTVVVQRPNL